MPTLELAKSTTLLKLDLACGQRVKEGFDGVDLYAADAKYKTNLLKFPWPWKDNSVEEIHCSHFIEHIPMRETASGQDFLFAFFDEMYRVLSKEGSATVSWPDLQTTRAFMDPTHRRFIPQATMGYLSKTWRVEQKLDHYLVKSDFSVSVTHTCFIEMTALHPEAQARRFNECWNTKFDNVATLKPIK